MSKISLSKFKKQKAEEKGNCQKLMAKINFATFFSSLYCFVLILLTSSIIQISIVIRASELVCDCFFL